MKITCTKCGKRFDAESHMYICPKCNHYQSQVGVSKSSKETVSTSNVLERLEDIIAGDSSSNEDTADTPEFIQTLNGEQRVYTAQKKTDTENKDAFLDASSIFKKISLAICIIVGFVMLISSTLGEFDEWSGDDSSWSEGWGDTYTEEEVEFGDPMCFETFTVNVVEVSEPEFDGLKAEPGWKLVQVNFTTESPYGYEDESMSTDFTLWYGYEDDIGYTEDGYDALYEDEITDDITLQNQLRDSGLVMEAHYSGNYFCIFEIPEEIDEVTFEITSFESDSNSSGSYTYDAAIRMPIEL